METHATCNSTLPCVSRQPNAQGLDSATPNSRGRITRTWEDVLQDAQLERLHRPRKPQCTAYVSSSADAASAAAAASSSFHGTDSHGKPRSTQCCLHMRK